MEGAQKKKKIKTRSKEAKEEIIGDLIPKRKEQGCLPATRSSLRAHMIAYIGTYQNKKWHPLTDINLEYIMEAGSGLALPT